MTCPPTFWVTISLAVITVPIVLLYIFTGGSGTTDCVSRRPLIVGHRGSCGMLPEHTVESYQLAIEQGADCIECDIVLTKDGVPICRHNTLLDETTDVHSRPEFASRKTKRVVDGEELEGFFAVDFTLEEIKQLGATQRLDFRNPNFDGMFKIATFQEQIDLVKKSRLLGKTCLYPEIKHTTWHNSLSASLWDNKRFEDIVLDLLRENGYDGERMERVYMQSFETTDLQYMSTRSRIRLIQLVDEMDMVQADTNRTFAHFMTEQGLRDVGEYAYGISPNKNDIAPVNATSGSMDSTSLAHGKTFVQNAHKNGLKVHPWVFRNEYEFLAWNFGQDPYNEYKFFVEDVGIDGVFTDFPETAVRYAELMVHSCTS